MNFLQKLESHTGGLLHIKSELYWYGGRGFDGAPGRVCLILDAAAAARTATCAALTAASPIVALLAERYAALLLIEDRPQWIWVSQEDVEIL